MHPLEGILALGDSSYPHVLVLALGIAIGSAILFGVSMALGAFLAGMVAGRSDFSLRAASAALPMSDTFAVLFFVSVGMLLEPRHLLAAPGLVATTRGIILVGKPLAALGIVLLLGYPGKVALVVAVALAQRANFPSSSPHWEKGSASSPTRPRTPSLRPLLFLSPATRCSIASLQ